MAQVCLKPVNITLATSLVPSGIDGIDGGLPRHITHIHPHQYCSGCCNCGNCDPPHVPRPPPVPPSLNLPSILPSILLWRLQPWELCFPLPSLQWICD